MKDGGASAPASALVESMWPVKMAAGWERPRRAWASVMAGGTLPTGGWTCRIVTYPSRTRTCARAEPPGARIAIASGCRAHWGGAALLPGMVAAGPVPVSWVAVASLRRPRRRLGAEPVASPLRRWSASRRPPARARRAACRPLCAKACVVLELGGHCDPVGRPASLIFEPTRGSRLRRDPSGDSVSSATANLLASPISPETPQRGRLPQGTPTCRSQSRVGAGTA